MKFLKSKYFAPIALLIFFMPFLRMCKERREVVESLSKFERNIFQKIEYKSISKNGKEKYIKILKEKNFNAYQLGFGFFGGGFNLDFLRDKDFLPIISYSFIILFSVLMIVFSWRRKYLFVRNLAIVNSILLIYSTVLFLNTNFIDEFGDVKYGFYVFLIYSILLAYIANKEFLESKSINLKP